MDTQKQGLNTEKSLWSRGMVSIQGDAQRCWLTCPTSTTASLGLVLYIYITIHVLTYLFFLAICVEGILQADASKDQAQYKYRVKAFRQVFTVQVAKTKNRRQYIYIYI